MVLDLKKFFAVEGHSLSIEHTLDMSDVEWMGLYPLKKPVSVKGSIISRASVVSLNLDICFEFSAPCDRCGEDTVRDCAINLDKALAVAIEGEESDTIITVPDMKLDIDELVFSEVILSLPTKHLCKDECKGICSKCGKNLNSGDCNCPTKEIDPRLQKLADLLKD